MKVAEEANTIYNRFISAKKSDASVMTNEFGLKYKLIMEAAGVKRNKYGYDVQV